MSGSSSLTPLVPGEIIPADGDIVVNEGRRTEELLVANTGDRPVQIGAHFHFFEANQALRFDREKALGMRLNIPSGTSTRFEPGEERMVVLVELAGLKKIYGLNSLTDGDVGEAAVRDRALSRAREQGYKGA